MALEDKSVEVGRLGGQEVDPCFLVLRRQIARQDENEMRSQLSRATRPLVYWFAGLSSRIGTGFSYRGQRKFHNKSCYQSQRGQPGAHNLEQPNVQVGSDREKDFWSCSPEIPALQEFRMFNIGVVSFKEGRFKRGGHFPAQGQG